MNRRRQLLVAFGASMLPATALTQKTWRVGFLTPQRRPAAIEQSGNLAAFVGGMRALGYDEGRNLVIEWRFAEDHYERLPALAAELVALKVDVIVTTGVAGGRAAQKATAAIPIVIASVDDPVGSGFVKTLARPDGNITAISNGASDVGPKLLEMLQAAVPRIAHVALLLHPGNSSHPARLRAVEAAARRTHTSIVAFQAASASGIDAAFAAMAQKKMQGVLVLRDTFLNQRAAQIAKAALAQRLPSIAGVREYVEAGGLMSYGSSLRENFRHSARYVGSSCSSTAARRKCWACRFRSRS